MYLLLVVACLLVIFTLLPLGIDFLRFVFPHCNLSRVVGRAAHAFLFSAVLGLFLVVLIYHYLVYLPLLLNHRSPFHSIKGVLHVVLSTWLWINVIGNYYHTIFMHPDREDSTADDLIGHDSHDSHDSIEHREDNLQCDNLVSKKRGNSHNHTKPNTGVEWKPARTHFCRICNCSISYWDHHCPFTGNCIGLRNYSNFFMGLCYGLLGGLYAVTITWPFFYGCNLKPLFTGEHERGEVCTELGASSYIFVPTFVGFYLCLGMVLLNVLVLLADLSTHNVQKYWGRYPMAKFLFQRIRAKKFLEKNSRLQVMIVKKRKGVMWYLLPLK